MKALHLLFHSNLWITLFLFLFPLFIINTYGQENCDNFTDVGVPFCQCTECGDLEPEWATVGTTSICEGEPFQLTGENSSSDPPGIIEDYHWYFIEISSGEIIDEFTFTTPILPPYIYELESEDPPPCNATSVFISVVLIITTENCAEGESCRRALKDLEILLEPRADFVPIPQQCENTSVTFSNESCYAENYTWDFGDGSPLTTTVDGVHTYQNPGTYTVTLTASNNNCLGVDIETKTIEIVGFPEAAYTYTANPQNQCEPVVIDLVSQSNEWSNPLWCINPFDTLAWCPTDPNASLASDDLSVNFKRCGKYEVIFKASNICGEVTANDSIEIFCSPFIDITSPPVACDMITLNCQDLDLNFGGAINNITWEFENANISSIIGDCFSNVIFTQSGTVTVTGTGPCETVTDVVDIIVGSTEPISFDNNNPSILCPNDMPIQFVSSPAGIWSPFSIISSDGMVNPSNLNPGSYTVTVSAGSVECPNSATTSFTILENFNADISDPDEACDQAVVNLSDLGLSPSGVDNYDWTFINGSIASFNGLNFPPITFNSSGSIILTATGECGNSTDTVQVIVVPNTGVNFGENPDTLCSTSSPIQLEASPAGSWSSSNLPTSALSNTGFLNPAGVPPGNYQITFTPDGDCAEPDIISISIIASSVVVVQDEIICIDSDPITLTADQMGGTWDGQGITDVNLGVFDPDGLNAGTYSVDYIFQDDNNCSVVTTAEILVENLPVITLLENTQLCLSDIDVDLSMILNYQVNPADGISFWSGDGITNNNQGTFNPVNAGLGIGFHDIYVEFTRNDCVVRDTATIEIIENEMLQVTPNSQTCINEITFPLTTNLSGGTWTGPGIDPVTGIITLSTPGGGTFTYNYLFAANTNCEQSATVTLEIIDLSTDLNPGMDEEICEGLNVYTLEGASPPSGTWSGTGIDASTGTIDLSLHVLDSLYIYRYCIESTAVQDCEACADRTFIVHSNPVASFELEGLPCINEIFQLVNTSTIANNNEPITYSWNFGDGTTSTENSPSHTYTNQGTYTITLIATSSDNCSDTITQEFYITTVPNADFSIIGDTEGCAPFLIEVNNISSGDSIFQSWCIAGDTILGPVLEDIYIDNITTDSIFSIVLKVENVCGIVTDEEEVLVHPYPIVDFGISSDEGCSPLPITFFNDTQGNANNYQWIISNGNTYATFEPPLQTFTTSDSLITVYTVTLIADNECGIDTLTKDITVFPPDVDAFIELDTLSGCEPFVVSLTPFTTPGAIINWLIYDEDGNVQGSELENPEVTLATPGIHTIVLSATNPNCGTDFDTAFIEVLPAPMIDFDLQTFGCIGDSVFFSNTSIGVSGTQWDFGDGNTSTDNSPFHIYQSAGTFTINLTAISVENGCPSTISKEILILDNPVAAFTPSVLDGCVDLLVEFQNESTNADDFRWDFGDDTSLSFEENPSHLYTTPGTYTVSLTAFDEFDCSTDSTIFNIIVYDSPISSFTFEEKEYCHRYDSLFLQNTSVDVVAYEWIFQSDTFNIENPVVLPAQNGIHEIELTVTNNDGCTQTSSQPIEIQDSPIAEAIVLAPQGCQGLGVFFENNSAFSDSFLWDFGNGNTSTNFQPEQIYPDSGTYTVILTSSNLNGCPDDQDSLQITVWPKPQANFDYMKEEECGTPTLVFFDNNSFDNLDNDWTFGDGGNLENVVEPEHLYLNPGNYPIQLIIENIFGCTDTLEKMVEIYELPQASFSLSNNVGCENLSVQLTNTSTNALSYQWIIDSFPIVTEYNPEILFTESGSFGIQLIASYSDLCQDTTSYNPDAIIVYDAPVADFTYAADIDDTIIGDVQFENLSIDADQYLWDFGDGNNSTELNPFHEYEINRSIDVLLTAYNNNGGEFICVDDTLQSIAPEWITTFFAPNAFAPEYGTDQINVFKPVGIGLATYEISIFSPWGDLVWYSDELENNQPKASWNGEQNGKSLPQGTYVWIAKIIFVDGTPMTKKGTVTILR